MQWLVKDLKASQEKAEKWLGDVYVDKNFVFAKTERHTGYPILFQTVENRMERTEISGINWTLPPHSLHHTPTLLVEAELC